MRKKGGMRMKGGIKQRKNDWREQVGDMVATTLSENRSN